MTNVLRSLGNLSLSPGTDLDTGQMKSRTRTLPEMWSEQKAMVYSLPNGNRKNISSQLSFARSRSGNLRGYRSFMRIISREFEFLRSPFSFLVLSELKTKTKYRLSSQGGHTKQVK